MIANNKNSLEVSGEMEVDDNARLVLFVPSIVPRVVLHTQQLSNMPKTQQVINVVVDNLLCLCKLD